MDMNIFGNVDSCAKKLCSILFALIEKLKRFLPLKGWKLCAV